MNNTQDRILKLTRVLREEYFTVILLESQKKDHPASQKSYLASAPEKWIKVYGNEIHTFDGQSVHKTKGNAWAALDDFYEKNSDWIFGYLGYDLKNHTEDLVSENSSLITVPDLYFFVPKLLIEINSDGEVKYLKGSEELLPDTVNIPSQLSIQSTKQVEREAYLEKIRNAQLEIAEGEYYEINLAHALEFRITGDALDLYERMKMVGPVPFASFIQTEDFSVCSSSPERFLSRRGNRICSQPIKGTVSGDEADESKILKELFSEKNKAENLMIVDLVRNDLNRVAIPGSVAVQNLFEIQSFETVHQMVSTVECEVADDVHSIDIIKACFPMGSMTGAPKISAMKSIEELEDFKRGIYSGAIGYIDPYGNFDFNVVIRTAIVQSEKLVYPVGGAITSDSVPEDEWDETLVKAKALLNSLD